MRILFAVAAACALGCSHPEPRPTYGDPIGVRTDDPGDPSSASSLEAAFAVTAGRNGSPLIPGVARALHRAAKECPALLALTKNGETLRLTGRVDKGLLLPDVEQAPSPELACLRNAVANQRLADDPSAPSLDIELEIAAPHAQATP